LTKSATRQRDPAQEVLARLEENSRSVIGKAGLLASLSGALWIGQAYVAASLIGALAIGDHTTNRVLVSVIIFVAIGLVRHGIDIWSGRMAFVEAQRIVALQRGAIIQAESLASPFASGRKSSAVIATLIGTKLDQLIPWITRYRIAAIRVRIVPFAILAAVFAYSWVAGLILIACGPLIPLFMALIGFAARDASEKHMAETASLNAMLMEWLNAGADIRLLDAADATVTMFGAAADSLRVRTMAVLKIAFLSSTVLELFSALGIAMTAVYVGFSLLGTFNFGTYFSPLTIGQGIFILLLTPDFFQSMRELAAAWHDRAAAQAVAGEIADLQQGKRVQILGNGAQAPAMTGPASIRARDLAFVTAAGREICYPDFTISPGEKLAITGDSGVGKSTLIGLLSGFAPASRGVIEVCGVVLDDESADSWRQRIAVVGQAPHMLNASLGANIALEPGQADPARIAKSLETAAAGDIVVGLERGTKTRLGETGSGVSGGEARRLTIARAIYKGAEVIFADEPTANLDDATADQVVAALIAASGDGATLIVATHDPRLVARMDRKIALGSSTC
jgi:ATP-binding cassette, subfamily C, bacterial CydD